MISKTLLRLFLVSVSFVISAQPPPSTAVEIFGGYSYTPISPEVSTQRNNLNGGHASVTINGGFVDFSFDVSGYKGGSAFIDVNATTIMLGPRFGRRGKRFSWFMHSLYGVSRINTNVRDVLGLVSSQAKTSLAMAPSSFALDVKLSERVSVRLFQADLLFIQRAYPLSSLNPRVSTGIVIHLGKR